MPPLPHPAAPAAPAEPTGHTGPGARVVPPTDGQERRRGERRRSERRGSAAGAAPATAESRFSLWGDPWQVHVETQPAAAMPPAAAEGSGLPRIVRTYVAARAALGVALALVPWLTALSGAHPSSSVLLISLGYALQALGLLFLRVLGERRQPLRRVTPGLWLATIGVDLIAFSMLRLLDPSAQSNYGALLVLPVLMGGVLTRRALALGTAFGVALVLVVGNWPVGAAIGAVDLGIAAGQAAMTTAGLVLFAALANEMASRLAREERSARSSWQLARQQTQLNRLVIDEMADGVLVVDREGLIRAINPAGRLMLGAAGAHAMLPIAMAEEPALAGLLQALQRAYELGRWPESEREQPLRQPDGSNRALQVRARFTRRADLRLDTGRGAPPAAEDICVMFLEDLHLLRQRESQDRLATMGRMSAGIAHEIRNPLAAIAQANGLLLEEALPAQQQRLAGIVAENVGRLKRIVDDVLAAAPGGETPSQRLDATAEVARICAEWQAGHAEPALRAGQRLALALPDAPCPVLFDAEHLRRVLVNLLDNAARHAGREAAAVRVQLLAEAQADGGDRTPARASAPEAMALLCVASDGPVIAPDVERHLFEPFFSTRSRGSGLGLYICRELCQRHGGRIAYQAAAAAERHRNRFVVLMRRAPA